MKSSTPQAPQAPQALQLVIQAAVMAYVAGELVGRWLHRANDQLARFWVQLVVAREATVHATTVQLAVPGEAPVHAPDPLHCNGSTPAREAHVHTPTAPMQHPLAEVAAELLELTAAELRSVLGTRQRCSKAQLVAAACSW